VAAALVAMLAPPRPAVRMEAGLAVATGAAAGAALFAAASRRAPRLPGARAGPAALLAKQCLIGLFAANEEVVWRRVVLGELLPAGSVPALAVSSIGFALAHHRSRALHLGTGAAFGSLYLATGALAASIAAHWVYNLFVASLVERART
jgi:membrane protease YdiL (CAAX protease family)